MKVTEKERERILISRIKNGKYKRKPKRKTETEEKNWWEM